MCRDREHHWFVNESAERVAILAQPHNSLVRVLVEATQLLQTLVAYVLQLLQLTVHLCHITNNSSISVFAQYKTKSNVAALFLCHTAAHYEPLRQLCFTALLSSAKASRKKFTAQLVW